MLYRDIILTVAPTDVRYFMNQLLVLAHEKWSRLPVALAFPQWQAGTPNDPTVFDSRISAAHPGNVLRVFSEHAEVLAQLEVVWGINELTARRVTYLTPVLQAPVTERGVAFFRVRRVDSANRHSKKVAAADRQTIEDNVLIQRHEWMYVPLSSVSTKQDFSLFVGRGEGPVSSRIEVGSFGFSRSGAPCFLPSF